MAGDFRKVCVSEVAGLIHLVGRIGRHEIGRHVSTRVIYDLAKWKAYIALWPGCAVQISTGLCE